MQSGNLLSYNSSDDSDGSDGDANPQPKKKPAVSGLVAYSDSDSDDRDSDNGTAGAAPGLATSIEAAAAPPALEPVSAASAAQVGMTPSRHDPLEPPALPLSPGLPCDPEVQADIARLLAAHGPRFLDSIRSVKEFRNPNSLDKVFCC